MTRLPSLASSLIAGLAVLAGPVAGCTSGGATDSGRPEPTPVVFDLGRDFSFSANPHGPWSYGYTRGAELSRTAFVPDTVVQTTPPVGFWHPGPGREGYYPYIAANLGSATVEDPTGSWAVGPGEVALEASQTGQFAVIQFTAPGDGVYAVAADFAGLHKGLSTTDVHVLLGDESVFAATIDGYGGDPSFLPRQGASPTASYRSSLTLRAGDVLTFAIGFGPNHTHFNDTTGLVLTIRTGG